MKKYMFCFFCIFFYYILYCLIKKKKKMIFYKIIIKIDNIIKKLNKILNNVVFFKIIKKFLVNSYLIKKIKKWWNNEYGRFVIKMLLYGVVLFTGLYLYLIYECGMDVCDKFPFFCEPKVQSIESLYIKDAAKLGKLEYMYPNEKIKATPENMKNLGLYMQFCIKKYLWFENELRFKWAQGLDFPLLSLADQKTIPSYIVYQNLSALKAHYILNLLHDYAVTESKIDYTGLEPSQIYDLRKILTNEIRSCFNERFFINPWLQTTPKIAASQNFREYVFKGTPYNDFFAIISLINGKLLCWKDEFPIICSNPRTLPTLLFLSDCIDFRTYLNYIATSISSSYKEIPLSESIHFGTDNVMVWWFMAKALGKIMSAYPNFNMSHPTVNAFVEHLNNYYESHHKWGYYGTIFSPQHIIFGNWIEDFYSKLNIYNKYGDLIETISPFDKNIKRSHNYCLLSGFTPNVFKLDNGNTIKFHEFININYTPSCYINFPEFCQPHHIDIYLYKLNNVSENEIRNFFPNYNSNYGEKVIKMLEWLTSPEAKQQERELKEKLLKLAELKLKQKKEYIYWSSLMQNLWSFS